MVKTQQYPIYMSPIVYILQSTRIITYTLNPNYIYQGMLVIKEDCKITDCASTSFILQRGFATENIKFIDTCYHCCEMKLLILFSLRKNNLKHEIKIYLAVAIY